MIWEILRWIRTQILMIRRKDTNFEKMGVMCDPAQKPGLDAIVEAFRQGYNLTLADDELSTLSDRMIKAFPPELCQFAHEGTGMCLTILDWFDDDERVERFLKKSPPQFDSLLMLGVGFALARAPWVWGGTENYAKRFAPGFDGLIMNGYGFHEGCFKAHGEIDRTPIPDLSTQGLRCFDHGLGRALWFVCGASPSRIGRTLAKIPAGRHPDLWAGLGTAACFAGRAYEPGAPFARAWDEMNALAGDTYRPMFNLGIALGAMLQFRSKVYTPWLEHACRVNLGSSTAEAGERAEKIWQEAVANASLARVPYATYQSAGDAMIEAFRR